MRRRFALASGLLLAVAACAGGTEAASPSAGGRISGELRVYAAASLTEAFTRLGLAFEDEHPGAGVTFNFAASSALVRQIREGAPADVFASADEESMRTVVAAGRASRPAEMARNRLAILVEAGNPKTIDGLADLTRPDVLLVLCAPEVPCGRLAAGALARAGAEARPASLEENVKAVVAKVVLGEADAGIVYGTDVQAAGGRADGVAIDIAGVPALEAVYPIAVTTGAANRRAAEAWVEFVLSGVGQATLAEFGFLPA